MGIKYQESVTATTDANGDIANYDVTGGVISADDLLGVLVSPDDTYVHVIRPHRVDGTHYTFTVFKFVNGATQHAANQQVTFTLASLA